MANRPPLVEPGEQEQVVDERAHPPALGADPGHRRRQLVGVGQAAGPVQVGVAPDGGQRRPQLVRRVGDEPSEPFLARGLRVERGLLLAEARLDLVEHRVEGRAEPPDLGAVVGHAGPVAQVAARDRLGRPRDALERQEVVADDEPGDDEEPDERDRAGQQQGADQGRDGGVDAGQRRGDRERDVPAHPLGEDAVAEGAVDGRALLDAAVGVGRDPRGVDRQAGDRVGRGREPRGVGTDDVPLAVEAQDRESPAGVAVGGGEVAETLEPAARAAEAKELVVDAIDEAGARQLDQEDARREQRDREHHRQRDEQPRAQAHRDQARAPLRSAGARSPSASALARSRPSARST